MGLSGKRVLLGITGGIGAYKTPMLVRELRRRGAEVEVVMTAAAAEFVTPVTLAALSGRPVATGLFDSEGSVGHIEKAKWADLLLVAPATANHLAKAARGIADDLLSTLSLAARCPVLLVPAMNTAMWEHPAVRENLRLLVERGVRILPPETGELACGEEGAGRMPDPARIADEAEAVLGGGDLKGLTVLVSAGPTREAVDPVRFLGNRSSGKMGYALAEAALARGAAVILVTGPVAIPPPRGASVVKVETAREMGDALARELPRCQWLLMAAAVADFRPADIAAGKIKRSSGPLALALVPNPDLLASLSPARGDRLLVGFAAETESLEERARDKLSAKGLDLVVANDVSRPGAGFDSDDNAAVLLDRNGGREEIPLMPKRALADRVLDRALALWRERNG